jgi:hypothetical protein
VSWGALLDVLWRYGCFMTVDYIYPGRMVMNSSHQRPRQPSQSESATNVMVEDLPVNALAITRSKSRYLPLRRFHTSHLTCSYTIHIPSRTRAYIPETLSWIAQVPPKVAPETAHRHRLPYHHLHILLHTYSLCNGTRPPAMKPALWHRGRLRLSHDCTRSRNRR